MSSADFRARSTIAKNLRYRMLCKSHYVRGRRSNGAVAGSTAALMMERAVRCANPVVSAPCLSLA